MERTETPAQGRKPPATEIPAPAAAAPAPYSAASQRTGSSDRRAEAVCGQEAKLRLMPRKTTPPPNWRWSNCIAN
jgi:hypothetical protein